MHRDASIRPTRVEIDLDALCANAALIRHIANTRLLAVVKADAYGHGAPMVARALEAAGDVAGFGVSLVEEGSSLRDAGVELPVLVMGPALLGGYDELVMRRMTTIISDLQDLEGLARAAQRRGRRAPVHLKIDTGMARLGIDPDALPAVIERARELGHLDIVGLSTHFACADSDDPHDRECMTYHQLSRFDEAAARARAMGVEPRFLHTANTSATLWFPESRRDLVRCGLGLYGNGRQPAEGTLVQSMRIVSRIAQLRDILAGASVSYGALWRAARASRLAVVPMGYADGVPRRLTGKAEVLIHGRRCPLVGAISMDMAIADVTVLADMAAVGDEVVLLGSQGDENISTAEFAERAGCTEYEVSCGVSKRVPRVYAYTGVIATERAPAQLRVGQGG